MIIGEYIKKKRYNNSVQILNSEKQKIFNQAQKRTKQFSKNYLDLENFLTDMFYGPNGKIFAQNIGNIYSELSNKNFNNFSSWSNISGSSNSSDDFDTIVSILTQKAGDYVHTAQIKKQTIENRKANLENYKKKIESIIKDGDLDALNSELYGRLKQEAGNALNVYEAFLKDIEKYNLQSNQFITSKKYSELFSRIDELDKIYTSFIQKMDILPSDLGNLMEIALALLSDYGGKIVTQRLSNEAIKELVQSLKESTRWKGPKTFSRQGLDLSSVLDVKYQDYITKGEKGKISVSIPCGKNTKLSVKTDFFKTKFNEGRQGKTDVVFTLPGTSETFSISAKNWKDLFLSLSNNKFIIQDFGDTTLAAALSRANLKSLSFEHWLYSLGPREANISQLEAAHTLAQVAIGADILMGYSQKKGVLANTIVINNRKSKRIQIFSTLDLLEDINKGVGDKVSISNYNSNIIRAEAKNLFDNIYSWRTIGSNYYKGALISYINNIHVTVKINPFL